MATMGSTTASTAIVAAPLLAGHHTSLMHGWIPATVQATAATVLAVAVGRRSRRWRRMRLPAAAAVGIALACWVYWYVADDGLAGNADAWAQFDPTTVMTKHGRYSRVSGWFAVNSATPPVHHRTIAVAGTMRAGNSGGEPGTLAAAESLCALGRANGIDCAVLTQPGEHDWPFAGRVFAAALPWLAGQLGTPGVPRIPLPNNPYPPTTAALHPAVRH